MDSKNETRDTNEQEVIEVISAERASEVPVSEVVGVDSENVVAAKPKRGLGIAALFFKRSRSEDDEDSASDESPSVNASDVDTPYVEDSEEVEIAEESTNEEHEAESVQEAEQFDAHEEIPLHKNGGLKGVIESMLFVSSEPLSIKQLAGTLDIEECRVAEAVSELEADLDSRSSIRLMQVAGGYQLCTRPEYGEYCAMILQPSKKKLSKAALETLAVVAYRQPCTMPEIEAVRGVSVDGVMRTLMERGLVKEAGRKQTPGRPILYATTQEFLEYFGLNDVSELPDIDMLAVEEVKALESQKELLLSENVEEKAGEENTDKEE